MIVPVELISNQTQNGVASSQKHKTTLHSLPALAMHSPAPSELIPSLHNVCSMSTVPPYFSGEISCQLNALFGHFLFNNNINNNNSVQIVESFVHRCGVCFGVNGMLAYSTAESVLYTSPLSLTCQQLMSPDAC
eukprot:PhM_4_TR14075/c0_g1_i1/m.60741